MTKDEALKLALDALENHTAIKHPQQIHYRDSAIAALKEALAQPAQEPVASITKEARGTLILHSGWDDLPNGTKFYTTPQPRPWVGLTDDEIKTTLSQLYCDLNQMKLAPDDRPQKGTVGFLFARAIEQALKEKNT
jgi:hypothetical protein